MKRQRRGKEGRTFQFARPARHARKQILVCGDALRGHMRTLYDGPGRDSSSRGSHGQIRHGKTGEENAA
jgi:hypothetical protein